MSCTAKSTWSWSASLPRPFLLILFLAIPCIANAANISLIWTATYVGDSFLVNYGLGSPAPNKTVYLYVNGSQVDSATDTSSQNFVYYPASAGNYTFDVYYSDSVNGPTSPTWNNTAGTYTVSNPPAPSLSNDSASGTVGVAFSYQIGGNYVSSYDASTLPPGLSVNSSNGWISGTPTTAGTWNATIYASNVSGTGSATLAISIAPAVAPTITYQPQGQSPAAVRLVGAGGLGSFALKADGTAWAWGYNSYSNLGDGTNAARYKATPLIFPPSVGCAAGGNYFTIAATSNGAVCTVGNNSFGQLGDGTTNATAIPYWIPGLSNVRAVAAGLGHSLALKMDGTISAWGYNGLGNFGDGTANSRYTPGVVTGVSGAIAVAAGYHHTVILKNDGSIWATGYNAFGQLGDGTTTTRYSMARVGSLTGMQAICCSPHTTYALRNDGTVWAWGNNSTGQLADGTTTNRLVPFQVQSITGLIAVASGDDHVLFLKQDGTVWACGSNNIGQLGDGTTTSHYTPVQVAGLSGVVGIAASASHSIALKSDGTVWGWGENVYGCVGDGTSTARYSPVRVSGLDDISFFVAATGKPVPTYQWQRKPAGQSTFTNLTDNSAYVGSTTAVLRVVAPTSAQNGDQFRCVVTNLAGNVTSSAASLVLGNPTMAIVSGNNQSAAPSAFNSQAFDVAVWNAAGSLPLMGVPVTFAVQSGGGMLATSNTGSPSLLSTITLNTDIDGTAQVFYQQPSATGVTSQITASSGGAQITFSTSTASPGTPPSAPPALRATTATPTAVSFKWGSSIPQGSASITGYNVYRNGTLVSSSQVSTSYSDSSVTAGTAYTYTVKAVDSTGAVSTAATLSITPPALSTSGTFELYTPTP